VNRRKAVLQPVENWRFYLVLAGLGVLLLLLVYRLLALQVLPGVDRGYEFLQRQGDVRTIRREKIPAHRGMITDRNGEPLAVSSPVVSIWANPKRIDAAATNWEALAHKLGVQVSELKQRMALYANKDFVYLKRQLSPEEAKEVLDLGIKGVGGEREYRRFYPVGEVAAHLIGFTNIDDKGQEGMELAYDQWLSGSSGEKKVIKDLYGRTIRDIEEISEAQPGKDMALSIDLRLQFLAYRELKKAVKKHNAKAASIVVLDAKTGEVLAMANQPSYNPNNRATLDVAALRNRALTDVFEPGSTVKPITITAALESGKFSPKSAIDTNPGYVKVGRKTLLDPVNYGVIDVTKVITKSSQVGTSKIALALDEHDVRDVFFKMGLGQSTATGFPGEVMGSLPARAKWKPIERATFAFGHGLSVTTAQLAQVYSVFASRGIKKPLSLLMLKEPVDGEQILESGLAGSVVGMLETVTQKGGTATKARIPAYSVAGKTGTTHKVGRSGYDASRYTSIFAGFAPASDPRLVAVVVIDEPSSGDLYYGGEVAAPVFSAVVGGGLRLLNATPDNWEDFNTEAQVSSTAH
jgi:cell division protein FtsI (penicillin-binding protein 3)